MKLRHYFPSLAALAVVAAASQAQDPAPKVNRDDPAPPVIRLPLEKPANVARFDAVRAAEAHNWHVVQSKGPEAWAKNPAARGRGVRVAVLDTGAQVDHPALKNSIKGTYNAITKSKDVADRNGHGTHCADTVRQLLPDCELVIVKVLNDNGAGSVDVIAHGIDWAVTEGKADVISLSLGGPSPDQWQRSAIDRALKAGVIVVAAAGNDGPGDTEGYPGRYPGVMSVGAADRNNRLAGFSSHGPNVTAIKYGVDIRAALPGNQEGDMSGTSMATPSEAACAGMWVATHPEVNRADRPAAYRRDVIAVSPFKDRTNARGYGMYTAEKIVGEGGPKPPPKPDRPFVVTITLADLSPAKQAELAAGGVSTFRLEVGHGNKPATAEPITVPVQGVPKLAPSLPPATEVRSPVPGYWVPPAPAWHQPLPAQVPQAMPGACPGGVCPVPHSQPGGWVPGTVIRRVLR